MEPAGECCATATQSLPDTTATMASITPNPALLSGFDVKSGTWKLEPGMYRIEVGAASDDLNLQTAVELP